MTLNVPSSLRMSANALAFFRTFLQGMLNRILVGELQYGPPNSKKRYLTRLKLEVAAYEKTGNMEHLLNAANYAYLEAYAPMHKRFHWDNGVDSATRGKI